MKPKTIRNIAGLISSAFVRAIRWGLVTTNPATNSEPPKVRKHIGMALMPAEQDRLVQSAAGPWRLGAFLEICTATGARRGEILALRWSDIQDGRALIDRSLCQTDDGLTFKCTKTERPRDVKLPASALPVLERHRERQDEFRAQFGPSYRADLDLIFANPNGTPLKPDSIPSTVSRLCRKLGRPGARRFTSCATATRAACCTKAWTSRRSPNVSGTPRCARPPRFTPRDSRQRRRRRPSPG
jgi:integrase